MRRHVLPRPESRVGRWNPVGGSWPIAGEVKTANWRTKAFMGLILGIITGALLLASALVAVWMVGAIYFDLCGGAKWGGWVALAWAAGVIAILVVWRPLWQPMVALIGAESLFLAWWCRLKPSNDRDWDPSMAVLPRAVIAGDAVTIENVPNLEYRSIDDFEPQFEARTYHLSNIKGVDSPLVPSTVGQLHNVFLQAP